MIEQLSCIAKIGNSCINQQNPEKKAAMWKNKKTGIGRFDDCFFC